MADQEFNATSTESIISQSAFAQSPASPGLDLTAEIIVCTPYRDIAEYQGTRAALEAEGVIPPGIKWPESFDELKWEDERLHFWLRRERPEGVRGPRKQFLDVDWWMVRFEPLKTESFETRIVKRKEKELADTIYNHSSKGQAERSKHWACYWEAERDEKFQAFKAAIPGITRPKRGRKPKEAQASKATNN